MLDISPTVGCLLISLLLTCCVGYDGHLIKAVEDSVGAENFTYYTYADTGPLLIVLKSISGDADLYVSTQSRKPTYLDYDVKSNTCGEDMLDLSQMKRPIYIGVFGTHAFETNEFVLYAYRPYLDTPAVDIDSYADADAYTQAAAHQDTSSDTEEFTLWPFFEFLLHVLEFLIQAIL